MPLQTRSAEDLKPSHAVLGDCWLWQKKKGKKRQKKRGNEGPAAGQTGEGTAGLPCVPNGTGGDSDPFAPSSPRSAGRARWRGGDMAVPRLVVFDLDQCCWHPEMFELSGAPTKWDAADNAVICGRSAPLSAPLSAWRARALPLQQ